MAEEIKIVNKVVPRRRAGGAVYNIYQGGSGSGGGTADSASHADSAYTLDDDTPVRDWFLSKEHEDVAAEVIDFLKGIRIAGSLFNRIIKKDDTDITYTDADMMSALRVMRELDDAINKLNDRFLRKDQPDQTSHLLKLLDGLVVDGGVALLHQGAQFGESFAGGLTGHGGRIDGKGHGELRSLRLWEFLEVPELRYNQVKVWVGIDWQCPGAGIIEKVTIDLDPQGKPTGTGVVKLKLEEGQYGAIDVDDIAMGIYHFGNSQDATENKDDSKGNFTFAGFATSYFRITAVSGEHNDTFSYSLRTGCNVHPQPMMHFACYGNFTKPDRQQSTYRTPTYTRRLWKQNTWEIGRQNIAAQDGDLSNLSIHGMQMQGYSTYLNSVYFTGTIQQVKPDGTPIKTANDRGKWVAGKYDYYDRVSHMGRLWLCVAETGTTQEPSLSASDWLLQVDKGEDGESPYLVEILSSMGDKFHNGVLVTTLSATVFEGKEDITDTIPSSRFSWTRTSNDKDSDKIWNQLHEGIGRYVDLTSDDVYRKAIFECLIII